jgi:hypothetical protein
MPIDRRTFMLGGGVASTLGAFASFGAVATVEPGARALTPVVAAGAPPVAPAASYQLRIQRRPPDARRRCHRLDRDRLAMARRLALSLARSTEGPRP